MRNLSLNMKFGQFIKSVGILQFQTVKKVYFHVLTMLSHRIINKWENTTVANFLLFLFKIYDLRKRGGKRSKLELANMTQTHQVTR